MQQHATVTDITFISNADPSSTAKPRGQPIQKWLVSFSVAYFTGALLTDLAYWQMLNVMWERFSIWLITAGLILAGLAALAYVIGLATSRQIDRPAWPGVIGYTLAVLLSLVNAFVHSRDAYTAVVPTGLMLSGLVVVVLLLTAWVDTALANRSRVGG
jgi:uncharacterized membrane protein